MTKTCTCSGCSSSLPQYCRRSSGLNQGTPGPLSHNSTSRRSATETVGPMAAVQTVTALPQNEKHTGSKHSRFKTSALRVQTRLGKSFQAHTEAVVWHATGFSSSVASLHSRIPTAFTIAGGHRGLLLADIVASFLFLKDLGGSRAVGSGSSHCEGRVSKRTQEAVVCIRVVSHQA